jgi:hypothetical protein
LRKLENIRGGWRKFEKFEKVKESSDFITLLSFDL